MKIQSINVVFQTFCYLIILKEWNVFNTLEKSSVVKWINKWISFDLQSGCKINRFKNQFENKILILKVLVLSISFWSGRETTFGVVQQQISFWIKTQLKFNYFVYLLIHLKKVIKIGLEQSFD